MHSGQARKRIISICGRGGSNEEIWRVDGGRPSGWSTGENIARNHATDKSIVHLLKIIAFGKIFIYPLPDACLILLEKGPVRNGTMRC